MGTWLFRELTSVPPREIYPLQLLDLQGLQNKIILHQYGLIELVSRLAYFLSFFSVNWSAREDHIEGTREANESRKPNSPSVKQRHTYMLYNLIRLKNYLKLMTEPIIYQISCRTLQTLPPLQPPSGHTSEPAPGLQPRHTHSRQLRLASLLSYVWDPVHVHVHK